MPQPKAKNVPIKWVHGPKGLNIQLNLLIAKMFFCNSVYFFERLQEFIKEFKEIKYFTPDDDFLKKLGGAPFVCDEFFDGLIMDRLYHPRRPIPLYLDDMKLKGSSQDNNLRDPMYEKYFWALWYVLVVDPQEIPGIKIIPLDKDRRYHFSFNSGDIKEDRFVSTTYVIFEYVGGIWHCTASYSPSQFPNNGKNVYYFLEKK